jgi:outer membrane biosynthesis protein TonB
MRFVFLFFVSFIIVNSAIAQDKKMSTQERLNELAKTKREYEEIRKKEWDAYLVRVEESQIAKKQKKQADSIEKSKLMDNVKKDVADFPKCDNQESPYYIRKNPTTGFEEKIAFTDYIRRHVMAKFNYPEFAMDYELEGRVLVQFYIDKEGNPQIKEANGPKNGLILEEEAIRIIKSLPTAIPATCDGKPINIMFAIPITFQMQE